MTLGTEPYHSSTWASFFLEIIERTDPNAIHFKTTLKIKREIRWPSLCCLNISNSNTLYPQTAISSPIAIGYNIIAAMPTTILFFASSILFVLYRLLLALPYLSFSCFISHSLMNASVSSHIELLFKYRG